MIGIKVLALDIFDKRWKNIIQPADPTTHLKLHRFLLKWRKSAQNLFPNEYMFVG
jgi:hypothetical protein